MLAKAIQRNIRLSASKATLVCRLIRNLPISEASKILQNQKQKTAPLLLKLLNSAASNAINNHSMAGDKLYVFSSFANQGTTLKRTSIRAKGRTDLIRKRATHLSIVVSDDPEERKKINKVLLKPRAHQHKYKVQTLKDATEIKPKKMLVERNKK